MEVNRFLLGPTLLTFVLISTALATPTEELGLTVKREKPTEELGLTVKRATPTEELGLIVKRATPIEELGLIVKRATPNDLIVKRGLVNWLQGISSVVADVVQDASQTVADFAVGTYKWAAKKVGGVWDALTEMFDDGWLNGLINYLRKIGVWSYQFAILKLSYVYEDVKTTWNLYVDLKNANFDQVVGHLLEFTRSFVSLLACMSVCRGVIVSILSPFIPFAGTVVGVLGVDLLCGFTCDAALAVVEDAATDAYEKATNQTLPVDLEN